MHAYLVLNVDLVVIHRPESIRDLHVGREYIESTVVPQTESRCEERILAASESFCFFT